MSRIGSQIQSLRKQQQLSQAQLGKLSGVKREYISRLERGQLKNPTLNTLTKLADGLRTPLENLLLFSPTSNSFLDVLQQSREIEQKINLLKDDLHNLHHLLDMIENFDLPFLYKQTSS